MSKTLKSRYAILGILANAPGSSGYDIHRLMKESTDFFWKESFSSIYPVLETLEKQRLIAQVEVSSSGRKRKTYKVTKEGKDQLLAWLEEEVEAEPVRRELLLKLFFGDLCSIDVSRKHVESYKRLLLQKQAVFGEVKKALPAQYPDDPGLPFWLLTLEFGILQVRAGLDWCEFAMKKLKLPSPLA